MRLEGSGKTLNESIFEDCVSRKFGRLNYSILKGALKMVHAQYIITVHSV
jgi:hypothetical protein